MDRSMRRDVRALQRRVEGWRRSGGGRGSRIPEDLWREAVTLARSTGLHATAKALRLNYENLKKRTAAAGTPPKRERPEFISLALPQLDAGAGWVIELLRGDGERMRIEARGGSAVDVLGLPRRTPRRKPQGKPKAELASIMAQDVDPADVARALEDFDELWSVLLTPEKERVLRLLIDAVRYDGGTGKLEIDWRLAGFTQLAEEVSGA